MRAAMLLKSSYGPTFPIQYTFEIAVPLMVLLKAMYA